MLPDDHIHGACLIVERERHARKGCEIHSAVKFRQHLASEVLLKQVLTDNELYFVRDNRHCMKSGIMAGIDT